MYLIKHFICRHSHLPVNNFFSIFTLLSDLLTLVRITKSCCSRLISSIHSFLSPPKFFLSSSICLLSSFIFCLSFSRSSLSADISSLSAEDTGVEEVSGVCFFTSTFYKRRNICICKFYTIKTQKYRQVDCSICSASKCQRKKLNNCRFCIIKRHKSWIGDLQIFFSSYI